LRVHQFHQTNSLLKSPFSVTFHAKNVLCQFILLRSILHKDTQISASNDSNVKSLSSGNLKMLWKLLLSLSLTNGTTPRNDKNLLPKGHVRLGHEESILHCLHICCKPHAKGARLGFSGRRGAGQYFSHSQSSEILRKRKHVSKRLNSMD